MSKRRQEQEDILKKRRAKVVTLSKDGLSMPRIAIELGTSIDCIFKDIKAVHRFQKSIGDTSLAPEGALKVKKPSEVPRNVRRSAQKRYYCIACWENWSEKGSWKPARLHESSEHIVIQGRTQKEEERTSLMELDAA